MKRDGVILAYEELNAVSSASPPLVFIHGWCGDHTAFALQAAAFSVSHRVVSVDLRGFGKSAAPPGEYSMESLADDVAWLLQQLSVERPVVVGHSMGGNVALELAARHPSLPAAIVMLDSVVMPPAALIDGLKPLVQAMQGSEYVAVVNSVLQSLSLPTDRTQASWTLDRSLNAPQHVVISSFIHHLTEYDAAPAASACRVPVAYISAEKPLADLTRFKDLTPQLVTAKVLGAGHYLLWEVPEQVNAMIARFLFMLANREETADN